MEEEWQGVTTRLSGSLKNGSGFGTGVSVKIVEFMRQNWDIEKRESF